MNRWFVIVKKYKQMSIPTKAGLWYTLCNILQKGISFLTVPLFVRVLTTTEYGNYTVFQSWKEILMIFATLNLYCGVFTKAMVDYEDDREKYISCMQGLTTVIVLCFLIIYCSFNSFWNNLFDSDLLTMSLMMAYFIVYPAFQFWSVRQRVEYHYKKMVIFTVMASLAAPLLGIILLYNTSLREYAVIWGYLISQIVVGITVYVYQFIKGRCFHNKAYWLYALKFNIPLIPHYLSLIVLGQSDRLMIKEFCGQEKTAIYTLAYQISMMMSIAISAINSSFVPWIYSELKNKTYTNIKRISNSLCVIVGVMTIGAILIAPEIIHILGTEDYYEAIWVVPAVATSAYFTFCYGLFSNVEFYFGATYYVMIASISGALLNLGLNAIFIPKFGYIAAGYTTLVCYLVFMIIHYYFMKKTCLRNNIVEPVFDMRFIWLSVVVVFVLLMACLMTYKLSIIRWFLIIVLFLMLIINRKRIVGLINGIRR